MNTVLKDLRGAVVAMIIFTVLCGVIYPLVVTGVAQVAFPGNANGQLVKLDGQTVGSKEIGQNYGQNPHYFQTRPSGTTPADNAAATTFANLGPNSTITAKALRANIAAYITLNGGYYPGGLSAARVPVDAADTSASGIDPDISVANAEIQAYRVAAVDHIARARVDALVRQYTGGRGLGIFGQPGVNVLELNLAIDRIRS